MRRKYANGQVAYTSVDLPLGTLAEGVTSEVIVTALCIRDSSMGVVVVD